jgi:hypothetical protein
MPVAAVVDVRIHHQVVILVVLVVIGMNSIVQVQEQVHRTNGIQLHQHHHLLIMFVVIMIVIHQLFEKNQVAVVVLSIDFEIKVNHLNEVQVVEQVLKVMIHH